MDAAVGGLVGLLGSQVLFSPDPVRLVEAPVRGILRDTADALRTAAEALRRGSVAQARAACEQARDAHARLGELAGARAAARRVTGRTVRGSRRLARLRRADRPLDDVDVLVAAVLLLCDDVQTRLARAASPATDPLPARLTELADGVAELAALPLPAMAPAMTAPPDHHRRSATHTPPTQYPPTTEAHLHDARTALHHLHPPPPTP
ncbi:hypothetical protein [Micromonospora sp. IBHARD004]|uniref:hypothetical protein n=1 Tax=Micromonospora sp. IBHARD004 TaxID=3457764 RepID=UPI004058AAC0